MHSTAFTLSLPNHAPPSTSTVQHSQSLACPKDCHLCHRHYAVASGYGFATIDAQELQRFVSTCDDCAAISEVGKLSPPSVRYPNTLLAGTPVVKLSDYARCSATAKFESSWPSKRRTTCKLLFSGFGVLSPHSQSAQATSPLEYITAENGTPSIVKVSPAVNQSWNMQDHSCVHVMDRNATLPVPHTSLLPPYAMARSSGHSQENVNILIFGDLDHNSVGPVMGLSSVTPFHDHTAGQAIDWNASRLPSWHRPRFRNCFRRMTSTTTIYSL
ncbi:hypothetical protein BKA82DRAFT_4342653 [Pisolithus tinctorius]|nr:hypothetical protein BKA82DRAFT_4342653 [Pisolithus tinctorius]